jgi:ribA/ribD-fused uncharacterized protein
VQEYLPSPIGERIQREILLATGDQEIVENARGDRYWGIGEDGMGKNMLGKILMEVREKLRQAE